MPDRLLRTLVTSWDDPDLGPRLRVLATAIVAEPELARVFREVVQREITDQMAQFVGGADAPARAAVLTTQLVGVIFARYVLQLPPVAAMPADELVRHLVPGLRTVLYGRQTRRA
jgi:Tetracyclin repressor-like, C-terminal domain